VTSTDNPKAEFSFREGRVEPPAELDLATTPAFGEYLAALDATSNVIIEMGAVTFVDSAGLRILQVAHARFASGGGSMVLEDITPNLKRLLEITALDTYFQLAERRP
jgi:anti-sigma B factor antagonist